MKLETLAAVQGNYNLTEYESFSKDFSWDSASEVFDWHKTGKMNIVHEAIDRHAYSSNKNKVALFYQDNDRKESYTFYEMMRNVNRAANTLSKYSSLEKGDRMFIFMPRSPELYFALLGALKMGVIVGPLFEAFMEGAVYDRLDDSDAKVLVTTPELLSRVPVDKLPKLETIFLVGEYDSFDEKYVDFTAGLQEASDKFETVWVDQEDGLVLHYTSGSTGKPKGILHVHGAMVQHYHTSRLQTIHLIYLEHGFQFENRVA